MPLAGERVRASDITGFEVGYAQITSNPTGTTSSTLADIAGLSVSVPVVSGRLYQVIFNARGVQSSVGATSDVVQLALTADGTVIDDGFFITTGANSARWKPNLQARYLATATETIEFTVQMCRNSGSGTCTIGASANSPAKLWVIDAGLPA